MREQQMPWPVDQIARGRRNAEIRRIARGIYQDRIAQVTNEPLSDEDLDAFAEDSIEAAKRLVYGFIRERLI